jgi:L-alanine-DL-glutamate epimerase-like enolase superfamily enzyme
VRLELQRRTLTLRRPLHAAYGEVRDRELLCVSLTGDDGVTGHGEAAPLQSYEGPGAERVEQALERYREVLAGSRGENGAQILDACRAVDDEPAALAAIDLALWDRAGRRAGKPLAALLTDTPAAEVPVNATITALDRAGAAEQAAHAVRDGFTCLKLKVGTGDDAGRVAAVRAAAGPETLLRLDANGAWSVEESVRAIDALSPAGLELVEEPTHGLRAVREVRERVAVRVAIDETAAEPGALGAGVSDAVCLKISRCGGIAGLLAAATLVRASGAEVYLASTLDGPLGIAAALHAAAALASRDALPHCGLATLGLFAGVEDQLPARAGAIAVPSGPGLGVEPL